MPILNSFYGSGSGGGNIGEPLNLTVTTSGLDATITWEDNEIGTIPPTTFQKSELVRKIGSAPTSPSDGTLVVTETVKDTYKTTGYVDQGLTDGETYYYRVFSYSDLGGISYCDAVNVTVSGGGWQPGANTIAYYPLTTSSTVSDMSGNGYDLTNNGGVLFGEYGGVDCASFDSTARNALGCQNNIWTTLSGNQAFTYSCRIYIAGNRSKEANIISINANNNHEDRALTIMTNGTIRGYISSDQTCFVYTPVISTSQRYYLTMTQGDGTLSIYLNGVSSQSIACNGTTAGEASNNYFGIAPQYPSNASILGYVSNVIVEDKARTAQEISDYYNQTKGDYGIS